MFGAPRNHGRGGVFVKCDSLVAFLLWRGIEACLLVLFFCGCVIVICV